MSLGFGNYTSLPTYTNSNINNDIIEYKPINNEQDKLYNDMKDASRNSMIVPGIMGFILMVTLALIIILYPICYYFSNNRPIVNKIFICIFILWLLYLLYTFYKIKNLDKKYLILKNRVNNEIPQRVTGEKTKMY